MISTKEKLIKYFEQNFIKKEQSANVYGINFKWEYSSLFKIISKPNLITFIQTKSHQKINDQLVLFFNDSVDQLRVFLKCLDDAIWEYLLMSGDEEFIMNNYLEFLKFVYSETRKIVNTCLIEILLKNDDIKWTSELEKNKSHQKFENDFYFFKNTFQKFVLKRLKLINKIKPHNEVIKILISEYESQLTKLIG